MTAQKSVKIEQALHGYSRGHKELAISSPLDPRSRATMLSYSDLLLPTGPNSPPTYLCAYPLKAAQRFVLARTWLGGEGLRPGSVWTHSLILDFPALTLIDDLSLLTDLLQLPIDADFSAYQQTIEFGSVAPQIRTEMWRDSAARAQLALRQLYGPAAQPIIALPSEGLGDESLAVALWRQMWPALRRNFAFLTGPATRAPNFDAECSLHFHSRRVEEPAFINDDKLTAGFLVLARDLQKAGPTDLRSFLGRYVIETDRSREVIPALALLHESRQTGALMDHLEKIRQLQDIAELPRLVRDTIVESLMQAPREADLLMLVEEYRNEPAPKNLGDAIEPLATREDVGVARLLNAAQPSGDGELGELIFDTVVRRAPLWALVDAADQGITRSKLLDARPDLWGESSFWPKEDEARIALARNAGRVLGMNDILGLFDFGIGPQVAALALNDPKAEPDKVLLLLDRVATDAQHLVADIAISNAKWIETFGADPGRVSVGQLKYLCDALVRRGARPSTPDAWIALVTNQARGNAGSLDNALLSVGFIAGLGTPSQRSFAVAKLTYDRLIKAVRAHSLSREQERFLSGCLSSANNNALRSMLAAAVVDKWHATEVNPQALSITGDTEALKDIVDLLVIRFGRGTFEAAIASKSVAPITLAQLAKVYQPKSKKQKSSWWWWDW